MVNSKLSLNISVTFLGRIIGIIAPFAIAELLLKSFEVEEYSDYLSLMQLLAVMVLMDLGIVNGSTRILNRVALKNASSSQLF